MIRPAWGLFVLLAAALAGALVLIDVAIRTSSSLILRHVRQWRHARYLASHARYLAAQGLPPDFDDAGAQRYVAARLRMDAIAMLGVTTQEWIEFCDAHPLTQVGGAS